MGPSLTIRRSEPPCSAARRCAPINTPRPVESRNSSCVRSTMMLWLSLVGRVAQRGAHRRRRREIEAAAQLEDERVAAVLGLQIDAQLVVRHLRAFAFAPASAGLDAVQSSYETPRVFVPARDAFALRGARRRSSDRWDARRANPRRRRSRGGRTQSARASLLVFDQRASRAQVVEHLRKARACRGRTLPRAPARARKARPHALAPARRRRAPGAASATGRRASTGTLRTAAAAQTARTAARSHPLPRPRTDPPATPT